VIVAVKHISEITNDKQIFGDYLLYFIIQILTILAVIALMISMMIGIGGFSFYSPASPQEYTDLPSFFSMLGSLISACILGLLIVWILSIISALYFKRSYHRIATHTNIELFKTAGTVYFIGALTLIFFVGFLIIFIVRIIEIIAYFSLPDETTPSSTHIQGRRCLACGRLIPEDAVHCPYCGISYQHRSEEKPKNY